MSIGIARSVSRMEQRLDWLDATDPQKRTMGILQSLPFIRAAWTMGFIDYQNPQVCDATGMQYRLTNNNASLFGFDSSAPYAEFDGVNQYLSRADGGAGNWADILGTEGYIPVSQRGLTIGGWFRFDRLTNAEFLAGKNDNTIANLSYQLIFRGDLANDPLRFTIGNGAAADSVDVNITPETGRWYFVAGRYDPGTEIKIYAASGGAVQENTNAVGIPAALNDSNSEFTIGAYSAGAAGAYLDGRASCVFLCAGMLSDAWIRCLYSQFRSIFRV